MSSTNIRIEYRGKVYRKSEVPEFETFSVTIDSDEATEKQAAEAIAVTVKTLVAEIAKLNESA